MGELTYIICVHPRNSLPRSTFQGSSLYVPSLTNPNIANQRHAYTLCCISAHVYICERALLNCAVRSDDVSVNDISEMFK